MFRAKRSRRLLSLRPPYLHHRRQLLPHGCTHRLPSGGFLGDRCNVLGPRLAFLLCPPCFLRSADSGSCRRAHKPSQWFSHKPNQKHPRPRKPDRFGSVPSVAGPCWSSRDLRPLNSNSARHPVSPEPTHETTIPSSPTRCPLPPAGFVCPACPRKSHPFPTSAQNPPPTTRKLPPNQSWTSPLPAPVPVPQAPLITPTPLNMHKRLRTGGSLQTAVSDAPRRTSRAHLRTYCRAHPIQR
jgi:hypothetical protein